MILHCPTGHLSAVVAGIACGLLPSRSVPTLGVLRDYFAHVLLRREPGSLNPVSAGGGTAAASTVDWALCLARGPAGSLVETALTEVARIAGHRMWIQPALRAAGARAGRGQAPVTPVAKPDPGMYAATLLARSLGALSLHGTADALMAVQVHRRYGQLVARARSLPGRTLRWRGPDCTPGTAGGDVRVVYHCFGAAHSSVTAAAIHCGRLSPRGPVSTRDVLAVPGFDRRGGPDIGGAFYAGRDSLGSDVFVIGFDGVREMITMAATELLGILPAARSVVLAETLPSISLLAKIGGFTSRRLGLVRVGRPLAAAGVVLSIPALRRTVVSTQAEAERLRHRLGDTRSSPPGSAGSPGRRGPVAGRGPDGA